MGRRRKGIKEVGRGMRGDKEGRRRERKEKGGGKMGRGEERDGSEGTGSHIVCTLRHGRASNSETRARETLTRPRSLWSAA